MQHDSDEIKKLRISLDNDEWWGYGILIVLLQKLERANQNHLEISSYPALSFYLRTDLKKFEKFMQICFDLKILETDGIEFWSEYVNKKVAELKLKYLRRSKAGKKGMLNRWSKK
jgi:hypothetical protein